MEKKKVALVTGAGRGIGREIALSLAEEGHFVIAISRSEASCQGTADEIKNAGGESIAMAVDVSKADEVKAASDKILNDYENVDILVNNAGITKDGLLFRMTDDDWNDVIQTNLSSCFYWVRNLGRPMTRKRWGRIINISSVIGLVGNAGQANYAAAKAGMIGFTKSLAKEFAARSVTVNAIAPGFIETDMTSVMDEAQQKNILSVIPLKKMGTSKDIAEMTKFLTSESANYITGQVFTVDGGMVM